MVAPTFMAAYVLVSVLNVIAEATDNANGVAFTKPLLMPLLLAWVIATVLTTAGRRFPVPLRWLAAGIVAAWAGDLFLMGDSDLSFHLGIAAFLLMQVCYIVAFQRVPGPGLVRAWKIAAIPYAIAWVVLILLVWGDAGAMRIPVMVYGATLMLMALAALDLVLRLPQRLAWRIAIGGGLFVLSDALIALTAFGPMDESVRTAAAIMATYTAAQGLIASGFTHGVLQTSYPELAPQRRDVRRVGR